MYNKEGDQLPLFYYWKFMKYLLYKGTITEVEKTLGVSMYTTFVYSIYKVTLMNNKKEEFSLQVHNNKYNLEVGDSLYVHYLPDGSIVRILKDVKSE